VTSQVTSDLDIAVVGMACRFPGAATVEAFWKNLREGVESVSRFSDEELRAEGVGAEALDNPAYVRAGAVLSDVDGFDARFFGYTAREAQILDPQHRLFLETSWEALERAGYDPERHRGSIGVFGGASGSNWLLLVMSNPAVLAAVSAYQAMLASDSHLLASRVAYKLNLNGPAVVIQTACSTSLVATHMACQSLLAGECDMALAGGVSVSVPHRTGYVHEPDGILSRDGHCRAFDAEGSGTVKGSGVGVVVLKRLADALRDGDQVEAVIKGSAVNNDGARKVGFTAPGVEGQARVIRTALATAGLKPEDITYVEAHGTATALGDPIEVAALAHAFRSDSARRGYCAIGSVKTNIGHLDAAAGVAGLVKAILMLKHRELVPSLHFETPNARIDFADSPFFVATRSEPWASDQRPRRAGVSSFGIGGTNAHLVLEEAPPPPRREPTAPRPEILLLSARTETGLERASDALAEHLETHPEQPLGDVAFTLRAGRRPFSYRRAVVSADPADAARALAGRDPRRVWSAVAEEGRPVAFLFSGQGSQHVNMAAGLYQAETAFRDEVDACCEVLRPLLGLDLRALMFPSAGEAGSAGERLSETRITQPALFTIEYALARLWMTWGVAPESMIGHSVGEYVAACLAGVLGRDEALSVVAERARLMNECPPGSMTGVALAAEALQPLLDGRLDLCVVNGPDSCVAGGRTEDVEQLEARLTADGVAFSRLPTSHAFHSAMMEPALEPFAERLSRVRLSPPSIPFVSSLTGTWITAQQATDAGYWMRQLREPVRFAQGLEAVIEKPQRVLLEVGPGHTLAALAKRRLSAASPGLVLTSLPHPRQEDPDATFFLQTAARLWTAGAAIDWSPRDRGRPRRRVLLPTYPFERERYWIDAPRSPASSARPSPAGKLPPEQWLYAPSWRRADALPSPLAPAAGSWCVFADEEGIGAGLAARLREGGATVTLVKAGAGFEWREPDVCVLEPTRRADYERLFDELSARDEAPARFVHLWGVGDAAVESLDRCLVSVLRAGEVLGRRGKEETSLVVVSSASQDVLGDEPLSPLRAAVLGPCRVLSQEYPLLACRTVDVRLAGETAPDIVDQLLAEVASGAEATVAYRGRYRWIQSFDPIPPAAMADGPRLRPRGVYLVTGGLGNVGMALASYLARTVKARLVLTGRSGLPDRAEWDSLLQAAGAGDALAGRIRAVRELEEMGAEVLALRADAGDLEEMRGAMAQARERFGRVDGIIHAAGDVGPGVLRPAAQTEPGDIERQLRPKLGGAQVIDALLEGESPDFVFVTSSLSTVLGGLGYAAYSAVNCALDAFARGQHLRGKRFWMSGAWDAWRFQAAGERDRLAQLAIGAVEGGETFGRILALGPRAQVVISTASLQARLDQWTKREGAEGGGDESGPELARGPRPQMSAVYVAPDDPVERRLAVLWGDMLGIDRVGVDDNFFELGGSSLLAIHLIGRLKKEYPVELSVATLFEASTVRTLSRVIRSQQGPDPGLARSADRGQARKGTRNRQRRTSDAAVD
jgi:phthiocerol/phenolphthiocerol synthesis type-I polyketide synthase E